MQTQTSTPAPGAETNPFIVPKDIVNPQKQVTNSSQQTSTTNLTDMSSMGATDALPTAPAPVQIPVNSISSIPTTPYYPQQTMNNPLSQMIYGNGNQNQLSSQLQAAMGPQANTVPPPSTDSLTQSLITAAPIT
jgi:hypothetical protein